MIATKIVKKIVTCFPNSHISEPIENASFVFDSNGYLIGHFDYSHERFYLNRNYSRADGAADVMKQHNLQFKGKEYELPDN